MPSSCKQRRRFARSRIITILALAVSAQLLGACATQRTVPLSVDLTSHLGDDQQFQLGDPLSLFISLPRAAHLYLYYENSQGQIFQLMPSAIAPENHLDAGDFIEFPPAGAPFTLEISPPFGPERLWLMASDAPLSIPFDASKDLEPIPLSLKEIQQQVIGQARNMGTRYAEDMLSFATVR